MDHELPKVLPSGKTDEKGILHRIDQCILGVEGGAARFVCSEEASWS